MSFEDEVRQRKEELQAAAQAEAEEKRRRNEMEKALRENGFRDNNPPVLQKLSPELQALIDEAKPSMVYINPKIIQELPDGTIRCRRAKPGELPDAYSLDLCPGRWGGSKGSWFFHGEIWLFDNNTIAFVLHSICADIEAHYSDVDRNWDSSREYEKLPKHRDYPAVNYPAVQDIRRELISQIAIDSEKKPEPVQPVQESPQPEPPAKSEGCYIATSVYGSYDCPEVRVLRRYRDVVLRANPLGRLFVKAYYAVSPFLVKRFGKTVWFQTLWMRLLDAKIAVLRAEGISDAAYHD